MGVFDKAVPLKEQTITEPSSRIFAKAEEIPFATQALFGDKSNRTGVYEGVDVSKYEKYIPGGSVFVNSAMNEDRAQNQSNIEKIVSAARSGGSNVTVDAKTTK